MRGSTSSGLLLALAALAGGCRVVGATAHNLDELHADDGRHQRSGRILTHSEYLLRNGLLGVVQGFGAKLGETKPKSIEDPVETCVDQLNDLAGFDDSSPVTASLKVEHFARAAVLDPWNLSRVIAVRELGDAGQRLELSRHPEAAPRAGVEPATPEQVRDALQAVLDATRTALDREDAESRELFAKACEAMAALPFEVEGGTRVLRSLNILLRAAASDDPRIEPLRKASLAVQRKLVWVALERARSDEPPASASGPHPGWPNPRVQAAAIRAGVDVWGDPKLREILSALGGLEPEPLVAAMRQVARRGLPPGGGDDPARERRGWTEAIVVLAGSHVDGTVRIAAMSALGRISGLGRTSLREEDWQTWWLAESARDPGAAAATP